MPTDSDPAVSTLRASQIVSFTILLDSHWGNFKLFGLIYLVHLRKFKLFWPRLLKKRVLGGSWDLATRVIYEVTTVIVSFCPIKVLIITLLTKSNDPPSRRQKKTWFFLGVPYFSHSKAYSNSKFMLFGAVYYKVPSLPISIRTFIPCSSLRGV